MPEITIDITEETITLDVGAQGPQGIQGDTGPQGDISADSDFGTDNVLIRSDGTEKEVQATGISVDDSDNITGINNVTGSDTNLVTGTAGSDGQMGYWNSDGDWVATP